MSLRIRNPREFPSSRAATPSPERQPTREAPGLDGLPVPDLLIPAETQMEHDHEADEYFPNEEAFESSQPAAFHKPEQCLTALPSMDKSPEKRRPSQDSAVSLDLSKSLPPSPRKRLFSFLREKQSEAHAAANNTTNNADAPSTSRSRRVMTSVGGGLRALRLLSRSHADLRKESSRAAASSTHLAVGVPACPTRRASKLASASAVELSSGHLAPTSNAPTAYLQFPSPPGQTLEDPEVMRVRASLEKELEEQDHLCAFGSSSLALPRVRGRQQQQQLAELEAHSRSPSTETVIRRPRSSSMDTVLRAARRASTPARLPLTPVILGQPIAAARPSPADIVPAAVNTTATITDAATAAVDACRVHRSGSRNFSRPFAFGVQGVVGGRGEEKKEEELEVEGEAVGLAISMGPSSVKPLERQQAASLAGDCVSPVEDTPADWPLREMRSFVGDAALDKPLPALPEETE
ncbi:hypothetical protein IWX49DRAFT_594932 [Phyllosticta citricarpa]|uniref:Proteophosphoglycan ppg4 n=2 Tax=Phyllosticta TaxID=121621 RepID=A0ABR1LRZ4_9PEZI